jgi:hypothetical protein
MTEWRGGRLVRGRWGKSWPHGAAFEPPSVDANLCQRMGAQEALTLALARRCWVYSGLRMHRSNQPLTQCVWL